MALNQGVPMITDYRNIIEDDSFLEMEEFSNEFNAKFFPTLQRYTLISDPLHKWSRQWEYPFVYSHLDKYIRSQLEESINILDAGAGITFFPFYVNTFLDDRVKLTCVDMDESLPQMYQEINSSIKQPVKLVTGDIQQLPFKNDHFNVVYCISVIEHMTDFNPIPGEFYRVLKPGGLLVVTFDISLSKKRRIPLNQAIELVSLLESYFQSVDGFSSKESFSLLKEGNTDGILSTEWIKHYNRDLLPWRQHLNLREIVGHLVRFQIPTTFVNLTCFCEALIKA